MIWASPPGKKAFFGASVVKGLQFSASGAFSRGTVAGTSQGAIMLTQKAKYALRALIMLAERTDDELVLIADIAERENIPRKFLEAILVELRKHGLLFAKRGKSGGYRLARPASDITFGEVIRLIDGHLAPIPCASKYAYRPCEDCQDPATCSTRWLMIQARDAIAEVLDNRTLTDALRHRIAVGEAAAHFDI